MTLIAVLFLVGLTLTLIGGAGESMGVTGAGLVMVIAACFAVLGLIAYWIIWGMWNGGRT